MQTSALLLLLAAAGPTAGGDGWYADFDVAAAAAREQGKDLLVDFTGSDWCGWCIRLDEEVFSHEAFLEPVRERFVLVALDFPRGEAALAKVPDLERNRELQRLHGVEGFPTVLLMTPDGEVFHRTGYEPGGPEPYRDAVLARHAAKERVAAARDAVLEAEGEPSVEALARACEVLAENGPGPLAAWLEPAARAAFERDADGTIGLRGAAVTALVRARRVDAEIADAALELDPENERGLVEEAVRGLVAGVTRPEEIDAVMPWIGRLARLERIQDREVVVESLAHGAMWARRFLDDPDRARELAETALRIGTDDPRLAEFLRSFLDG